MSCLGSTGIVSTRAGTTFFVVTQRVRRKTEQFPSTHCPRALACVAVGLCPAPLPGHLAAPSPPQPRAPKGKGPVVAYFALQKLFPGELCMPAVPTFLGKADKQRQFP